MSTKSELAQQREANRELRRTLAKLAPSGNRNAPDRVWKLLTQYADHFQYLASMTTPLQSRSVGMMGRGSHVPHEGTIGSSTRLSDKLGDRTVWHNGRPFEREAERLYGQLQGLLDQSAAWVRGIDLVPTPAQTSRRPKCDCGQLLAITWGWCPHCGRSRLEEEAG